MMFYITYVLSGALDGHQERAERRRKWGVVSQARDAEGSVGSSGCVCQAAFSCEDELMID